MIGKFQLSFGGQFKLFFFFPLSPLEPLPVSSRERKDLKTYQRRSPFVRIEQLSPQFFPSSCLYSCYLDWGCAEKCLEFTFVRADPVSGWETGRDYCRPGPRTLFLCWTAAVLSFPRHSAVLRRRRRLRRGLVFIIVFPWDERRATEEEKEEEEMEGRRSSTLGSKFRRRKIRLVHCILSC